MRVTIFSPGYVGLVTGPCLADAGNRILCMNVDAQSTARLNQGEVPTYEPGLDSLIQKAREAGRLDPIISYGRHSYDPVVLKYQGFRDYAIGRGKFCSDGEAGAIGAQGAAMRR